MRGKVAWISGGSGGIGQEIAKALARCEVNVGICFYTQEEEANRVAQVCRKMGTRSIALQMDVTDRNSVMNCYRELSWQLGRPHFIIHAAGDTEYGLFQDMDSDVYDHLMDVHVRGAYHMAQTALPYLIEQKDGRIILLSSIWGEVGGAGEVLYSAAKGAINGMTKALGKELATSGITVNAVAPGAIDTPLLRRQLTHEERAALIEEIPAGRLGKAEDVAACVRFLCSAESSYLTGQILHVNGGWYT